MRRFLSCSMAARAGVLLAAAAGMETNGGARAGCWACRGWEFPPIQMTDAAYRRAAERAELDASLDGAAPSGTSAQQRVGTYRLRATTARCLARAARTGLRNMTLGGGTNLAREPRNGRTFEYMGEDPVLAGTTWSATASKVRAGAAHRRRHQALRHQRPGSWGGLEVDSVMDHRADA